ncbi:MAG: hypothetical protein ACWA45_00575 [Flavobacteriales bacterium]
MKTFLLAFAFVALSAFTPSKPNLTLASSAEILGSNISLINDTKEKISLYTGSGFVSLNKDSKTSISCKVGKEVCWAEKGKKKGIIFKITNDMCGKTLKISSFL